MPNPNDTNPTGLRRTTSTTGQEPDSAAAPTDTGPSSRRSSMSDVGNPNNTGASNHNERQVQRAIQLRDLLTGGAGAAAAEGINEILNNEAAHPKDLTAENKKRIEALTKNIPTWNEFIGQNLGNSLVSQNTGDQYEPSMSREEQRNPNNPNGLHRQNAMTEKEAEHIRNISQGVTGDYPLERQDATSESALDPEAQRYYADTLGIFGYYGANEAEQEVDSTIKPGGPGSRRNPQQ